MTAIAKVFMSGRSQALRLPAKLRLQTQEVCIEQIGHDLWVHPKRETARDMGHWLQAFYAASAPLPDDFLSERQDPPAQTRDWS